MVRDPRLSGLRPTLVTRRNGWVLAAVLAIFGILLAAQQLSRAADLAGQALGDAMRLVLDAGWLLLLAAAGLAVPAWPSAAPEAGPRPSGCAGCEDG